MNQRKLLHALTIGAFLTTGVAVAQTTPAGSSTAPMGTPSTSSSATAPVGTPSTSGLTTPSMAAPTTAPTTSPSMAPSTTGTNPSMAAPTAPVTTPSMGSSVDQLALPSKTESATAAFSKLSSKHPGYITSEDAAKLQGFDFKSADKNNDGKLDQAEFNAAWTAYTGTK